ncbi:phage tail spike protein [Clostridium sp. Marseille-Q2269]|uniref:phage tail spike protein n=1 Tax=Clostridium sp. Marseille-Q2269 TaxID=2942205 RepID=UPI002073FEB9|nr:phage tail spike protein [Clostridium sp. Marseille-Q2269]
MIKLFEPTATDFTTNGVTILTNAIDAEILEELNGAYTLTFKYPIEKPKIVKGIIQSNVNVITNKSTIVGTRTDVNLHPKSYFLQKDYIVYANGQAFRIYNVKRDMSTIEVNCRHIFYDLLDNFLEDVRPTKLNRLDALKWILERTQYPHKFTATGNLGGTNTRNFIRKNVVESIMGEESILSTWGGEIVRDNFSIGIWDSRGNDRGVLIQGGKNLVGIEEDLNTDNVITRVMPTGLDENDTVIMLPEKYIDSPYINAYPHPKVRHIHYGDIKVNKETGITKDDVIRLLRLRVKELYEVEKVDIPEVNYKVDFIELSKTEEYKNYISLEKVEVGDTVTVRYNKLNLDIKAKVIKTTKRQLGNTWINDTVELGNFKKDISNSLNKIDSITTPDGKVKGEVIWGSIDAAKATLKAMADSAETQVERAAFFEDRDTNSPTYGAMCLGTRGFQIAKEMSNGEWQWSTFGTGQGFTADLISAGVLKSLDGTLKIDLGGGAFRTYNNTGFPAIDMENMNLSFYDWKKANSKVGMFYTSYQLDEPQQMGLSFAHFQDYIMNLTYYNPSEDNYLAYITFDKYFKRDTTRQPITISENMDVRRNMYWYWAANNAVMASLQLWSTGLNIGYMGDNSRLNFGRQWTDSMDIMFSALNHRTSSNHVGFASWENAHFDKEVRVSGALKVDGSKNSLQKTQHYGDRLINAYETMGYYFGDLGSGIVGEDGIAIVAIEDMVTEVMNTDIPYHVTYTEIVPYELTDKEVKKRSPFRLVEMKPTYFIFRGEPNTHFTWELKAKRKGYEQVRAENNANDTRLNNIDDHIEFESTEENDNLENVLLEEDTLIDNLLGGF